jgi:hypothetical protein
MQEDGFDVQVCGFGLSSVYHGDNEYCKLSDMVSHFSLKEFEISAIFPRDLPATFSPLGSAGVGSGCELGCGGLASFLFLKYICRRRLTLSRSSAVRLSSSTPRLDLPVRRQRREYMNVRHG